MKKALLIAIQLSMNLYVFSQSHPVSSPHVLAKLFGSAIATNWAFDTGYIGANSSIGMGNDTYMGKAFQSAFSSLLGSYSGFNFIKAAMTFKAGSEKNASSVYNNYPLIRENQKKSLIKSFYPLIK